MMKSFTIHSEDGYSSFPRICQDGINLYTVFRHAPVKVDETHIHYESMAIIKRAVGGVMSWRMVGAPISAHIDDTGIQDPCLAVLEDGTFILSYFHWRKPRRMDGIWIRRSFDKGRTWGNPMQITQHGHSVAACHPIIECGGGTLLLAVYDVAGCWLTRSFNGGTTWQEFIPIVKNTDYIEFSEPSLVYLDGGHILCALRTLDKRIGRSTWIYQTHGWNLGRWWQPPSATPMRGLPPSLLRLNDGRILCSYGYRRAPFGVRSCLSGDEGETWGIEREVVLRADGADFDVGYPSSIQLDDERVLTAYYIHTERNPTRRIEGTIWSIPKDGQHG